MKVLVCGGRDYAERDKVFEVLNWIDQESPITCIIHGGARGADSFGEEWGQKNHRPVMTFKAHWEDIGRKKAGPIRNGWMLEFGQPDLVVAFPGGPGTHNMKTKALNAGIEVFSPF